MAEKISRPKCECGHTYEQHRYHIFDSAGHPSCMTPACEREKNPKRCSGYSPARTAQPSRRRTRPKARSTTTYERVEGHVWCDKEDTVHRDTLDPYEYGPGAVTCQPEDHQHLYTARGTR